MAAAANPAVQTAETRTECGLWPLGIMQGLELLRTKFSPDDIPLVASEEKVPRSGNCSQVAAVSYRIIWSHWSMWGSAAPGGELPRVTAARPLQLTLPTFKLEYLTDRLRQLLQTLSLNGDIISPLTQLLLEPTQ